jgi:hypothetical protein
MLMGNASKILQTVCANIDRDVMTPNLQNTLDMILLTDTSGLLTGQEEVVPKGVNVAMQKETMRARQLEFLQITANPIDLQIIGPKGRANVLRSVAGTIGLDGEEIVPTEDALNQQQNLAQTQAAAGGVPGHAQVRCSHRRRVDRVDSSRLSRRRSTFRPTAKSAGEPGTGTEWRCWTAYQSIRKTARRRIVTGPCRRTSWQTVK